MGETPQDQSTSDVHMRFPGLWGGPRKCRSVRIDDRLYLAFKERTRLFGDSVCGVVESMMAAYMGATEHLLKNNVHTRPTITIENLEINRQLARDRRRVSPEFSRLDEESVRDDERERLRVKEIREKVREEVHREKSVEGVSVVDAALVETLFEQWTNPGKLTELNELLNVHNITGEDRARVRDAVIDYYIVHISGKNLGGVIR